ncbi:hypothetical protein [Lysobacter capsici]|nr:hypothetical protein [Lysobacter capsici]
MLVAATDVFKGPSAPVAKFADALLASHPGDAGLKTPIAEFGKASRR